MSIEAQAISDEAGRALAGAHPLAEPLESGREAVAWESAAALLSVDAVVDLPSLERFLRSYRDTLLVPHELPAIRDAWALAEAGRWGDLVGLSRSLSREPMMTALASASWRAGRRQLMRLRPLKDVRPIQRFGDAVKAGEAKPWHTLVYGAALAAFSLPPRQGLTRYAIQTQEGFVRRATERVSLPPTRTRNVTEALWPEIRETIDRLLLPDGASATFRGKRG